jgi:branched-chain amino acid transport system permease protein
MNFVLHIIVLGAMNTMQTLGYNVVFGKAKILHFGQVAQTLGFSYVLWVLVQQFNIPFLAALAAAVSATLLLALLLAWLSLRLQADGLGVMSIALHLALITVILNWQSVTRGALGVPGIPRLWLPSSVAGMAAYTIVLCGLWGAGLYWLQRGCFGRRLAALAEHDWYAAAIGINLARVHSCAFILSAVGSILTGLCFAPYLFLLSPNDFQFPAMIFVVMCVIAGDPGSVLGVLMATMGIVAAQQGLRLLPLAPEHAAPLQLVLFGTLLLLAVWWRRNTVFPHMRRV